MDMMESKYVDETTLIGELVSQYPETTDVLLVPRGEPAGCLHGPRCGRGGGRERGQQQDCREQRVRSDECISGAGSLLAVQ